MGRESKEEQTKATCVYLEDKHLDYLALMALLGKKNKSEYLREILEKDMDNNKDKVELLKSLNEVK